MSRYHTRITLPGLRSEPNSAFWGRRASIGLILLWLLPVAGCSDSTDPNIETLTPEIIERIAAPLSFMTFAVAVGDYRVTDIRTAFGPETTPVPVAATVTMAGIDISVADEDLYRKLFDASDMGMGSIPNPWNWLAALTRPDLQRLAYHAGMYLAWLLINESSEKRPDHIHEDACGTTVVTFDEDGLARAAAEWSECHERGIFFTGDFSMELDPDETDFSALRIQMDVTGDLTIGGGVPTVRLSDWEWQVEFPHGFPGAMEISMVLVGPDSDDRRTFTETVPVDD